MKVGDFLKKIFLIFCFIILLVGCGNYTVGDAEKDLENKISNSKGYRLTGEMKIINNDDVYKYDVDVSYKKSDKFKVSLKNKTNNHEQIILKNSEGVYVLTPTLNKSFKFQSDWPYNNSQVYLLQTLLSDIQNDKNKKFKMTSSNYIFITKVNYPNNSDLARQKIYFDKKLNPVKVEVMNDEDDVLISMDFKTVDMKPKFAKNYFTLDKSMKSSISDDKTKSVSKIDESIYPMYIPNDTKLTNKESISTGSGERVIMTFDGENPFIVVEQTASISDNSVISIDGNPYLLASGVASVSDKMVSWINNGIEYYVISDDLSLKELVSVANSMSVIPSGK